MKDQDDFLMQDVEFDGSKDSLEGSELSVKGFFR